MHLIPGSHLRPERHERQEGTPLFDLGGQVDAERAEVVELPAGGVMFHHCQACTTPRATKPAASAAPSPFTT